MGTYRECDTKYTICPLPLDVYFFHKRTTHLLVDPNAQTQQLANQSRYSVPCDLFSYCLALLWDYRDRHKLSAQSFKGGLEYSS